jgi:selenocysteine lyase/cysteine desulfurase
MMIPNQKAVFNIPEEVVFLNCANMSPIPETVRTAGIEAINKRSNPWKIKSNDWFQPVDELKSLFAQLINSNKDYISIIPAASYGMAIAAKNIRLQSNQKIILLYEEFPSNVYAWRELSKSSGAIITTIKKNEGQNWTDALLESIDATTGLVSICNCYWTDGSLIDLEAVSKKVRSVGAKLVIDASQSAGAYPIDVAKIKPDFLIAAGYKWLMSPYGLSYLYSDEKYHNSGEPIEYSWMPKKGSENFTNLVNYTDEYKIGAARFDAGEHAALIHVPMAIAALTQILEWGVENIQETITILTDVIEAKARQLGFVAPEKKHRAGHIIGITLSNKQANHFKTTLADNKIYVSFRGTNMRVSPHVYNTIDDVNRLFEFIKPY